MFVSREDRYFLSKMGTYLCDLPSLHVVVLEFDFS